MTVKVAVAEPHLVDAFAARTTRKVIGSAVVVMATMLVRKVVTVR